MTRLVVARCVGHELRYFTLHRPVKSAEYAPGMAASNEQLALELGLRFLESFGDTDEEGGVAAEDWIIVADLIFEWLAARAPQPDLTPSKLTLTPGVPIPK